MELDRPHVNPTSLGASPICSSTFSRQLFSFLFFIYSLDLLEFLQDVGGRQECTSQAYAIYYLSHEAYFLIQTTPSKPLAALNSPTSLRAESPTTARPLDFDDEPQESGVTTSSPAAAQPAPAEDAPPKPPRPLSPREQSEITLKEAFPSVEPGVVKAVLVASNWNVERAFNALLGSCNLLFTKGQQY